MNSSIPNEETTGLDFLSHLEELRRRIIVCVIALILITICVFFFGDKIMLLTKAPLRGLVKELIFISPSEAFVAYFKVVLLAGFVISFPVVLYHVGAFLSPAFKQGTKRRVFLWFFLALILFFLGVLFSYFLALPAALRFLIQFGEDIAVPSITLGKYVSFFGALILIGGIIFEIPVMIAFLADAGIVSSGVLKKKRHIAVVAMMIFSAVITPTQDIMNMLIFFLPMIALYEVGILLAAFLEKKKA
ncbi:MAG: twin-arginine translocase subunit TatC [Candidatus Omnitrophota bacterium]